MILAFVGTKMLLLDVVHVPTFVGQSVIAVVLAVTIAASLRAERREGRPGPDRSELTVPHEEVLR